MVCCLLCTCATIRDITTHTTVSSSRYMRFVVVIVFAIVIVFKCLCMYTYVCLFLCFNQILPRARSLLASTRIDSQERAKCHRDYHRVVCEGLKQVESGEGSKG